MNMMCDETGTRLFYRQAGTGAPVVLLHGFAASGAQWKETIGRLRARHRVITPDLPGYGGSQTNHGEHAALGAPGLALTLRALADLVDRIGQPVHLVGHGFGAAVAAKFAMTHAGRVSSLALVEPCLFHLMRDGTPADRNLYRGLRALESQVRTSVDNGAAHVGMRAFIDHWLGAGTWDGLEPALRDMHASDAPQLLHDLAACFQETWSLEDARRLSCPVLACIGEVSPRATRRATELMTGTTRRTTLKIVAGGGHLLPVTHPETLASAISGHVARTIAGGCTPAEARRQAA